MFGIQRVDADKRTKSGLLYHWKYIPPSRNSPARGELSVAMDVPYVLSFERENWGRALAKALGFAKEFQTGDATFDKKIYILSDDPQVGDRLQTDGELRGAIDRLFTFGVNNVTLNKGKLTIMMSKTYPRLSLLSTGGLSQSLPDIAIDTLSMRSIEPLLDEDKAEELVQALNIIKRKLTLHVGGMYGEMTRTPPYQSYAKFFNWMIAILFAGGLGMFILDRAIEPSIVNFWDFFLYTTRYSVALAIIALALIFLVFGRSSTGYGVLRNFIFAGIAGIALSTCEVLFVTNVKLDKSTATIFTKRIANTYTTHSRKGGTSYYIKVEGWKMGQSDYSFKVNHAEYNAATTGMHMNIYIHPGYLGHEWIERHELVR
jgi:hypothetical protein